MRVKKLTIVFAALILTSTISVYAGNEDRAGSAGGTELLINPWARSASWGGSNVSCVAGLESSYINVAGLAYSRRDTSFVGLQYAGSTEINFVRTNWLGGSDIAINAFGLSQKLDDWNYISFNVVAMNFGDILVTTTELPEGGIGTYSPQFTTIGMSYARKFSDRIYGGITFKVLSQSIANAKAQGLGIDAGIKYVTGERDQLKIGITLKNVGPTMRYSGDAFSVNSVIPSTEEELTTEQRTSKFELPSLVNMGVSYDFDLPDNHQLTAAASFMSNSFTKDQMRVGFNYGFITEIAAFSVRGGYVYEEDNTILGFRASALSGPTAGASVEFGSINKGTSIGIDYSYRSTNPFNGVHSIGIRVNVK